MPSSTADEPYGGPLTRPAASETRLLDPATAYRRQDESAPLATAFVADSLLVRGWHEETEAALTRVAESAGFQLVWDVPEGRDDRALIARAGLSTEDREALESIWVTRVRLAALENRPEDVR